WPFPSLAGTSGSIEPPVSSPADSSAACTLGSARVIMDCPPASQAARTSTPASAVNNESRMRIQIMMMPSLVFDLYKRIACRNGVKRPTLDQSAHHDLL